MQPPPLVLPVTELKAPLFEPFGRILNPQTEETTSQSEAGLFDFYVPFTERSGGWSIGFLEYTGRMLEQLERHPNTPEVFSPLNGEALLVLAVDPEDEDGYRAFRLEKPIVLHRGVWHGVICLSRMAEILIVENPDVVDEYHKLTRPVKGE
jgi:ureidoglycolate hydrolase